jgi:hypothetical protein
MNASAHAWQQPGCAGRDRVDGVDGWGSPLVAWVQAAFHPHLLADVRTTAANPAFNGTGWPYHVDVYSHGGGGDIARIIAVFNDVLAGTFQPWAPPAAALTFNFTAVWDAPDGGDVVIAGPPTPVTVLPGFQARVNVSFPVPDPGPAPPPGGRALFLRLQSSATPTPATAWTHVEDRLYVRVTA